jgi:hypothetical protein
MRRAIGGTVLMVLLLAATCLTPPASATAEPKEDPKLSQADAKKAAPVPKLGPAFETDPELMAGFRALYEQDFPAARAKFAAWCAANPEEAFGQVSLAAGYLFDEFNRHGVLTSGFFMNDEKFLHGIEGEADPERMKGFHAAIDRARAMATAKLKTSPADPNALFALTMAAGMESDDFTIVEKKHMDGLKRMKEANDYAGQVISLHPEVIDVYVAPGSANYIIGCLSDTTRFFLWFGGIKGDKNLGMEEIGKTADGGRYLKGFAQILLALSLRREKQDAKAAVLLKALTEEYPKSPLFAAEYAKVRGLPVPAQLKP